MDKLKRFIKLETSNWKKHEIAFLLLILFFILINSIFLKDNLLSVISAVCGILYTIIAGKGKISCFFFGLLGSVCYSILSFKNAVWGSLLLSACYYIPMEIISIFKWKNNLKEKTNEIIKTKLNKNEILPIIIFITIASLILVKIFYLLNDASPIFDTVATIFSIVGMYLTVKRCIEQWIMWIIVNLASSIMWIDLILQGSKSISTVIMWVVYLIMGIYFLIEWKKEVK